MTSPSTISIKAPAKINLHLAVTSKRPDGYHDLDTVMVKLSLADDLQLTRSDSGVSLDCSDKSIPSGAGNLVYRAANEFLLRNSISKGVHIRLEKKIPVAAGLGGGSSDAAAVLGGMQRLFAHPMEKTELFALGKELGADVPFFISPHRAARATGIGDKLEPLDIKDNYHVVLVNPGFNVSTKWVYDNFALTTSGNPYMLGREWKSGMTVDLCQPVFLAGLRNDLESVTVSRFNEIAALKSLLVSQGAVFTLMSGSGPTVFGIFVSADEALNALEKCCERGGCNGYLTQPLRA